MPLTLLMLTIGAAVALLHPVVGALGAEDRREQVQRDDALGEARARGGGVGRGTAAGVVDEDVDAAELLDDGVDERERGFAVADVAREERPAGGRSSTGLRAQTAMVAPASSKRAAMPRPTPLVPPVTSTTLPVRSSSMVMMSPAGW